MVRCATGLMLATVAVLGRVVIAVALVTADLLVVDHKVVGVLLAVHVLALNHHDLVHLDVGALVHLGGPEQAPALVVARLVGHRDVRAIEAHLGALAPPLLAVDVDVHALGVGEAAARALDRRRRFKPVHVLDKASPDVTVEARQLRR